MADSVELKPDPVKPPADQKLPEATTQPSRGDTTVTTVDTTKAPVKDEKKPERPAWLPEGFDTPEQFAEAYRKQVEEKAKGDKKPDAEKPKDAPADQKTVEDTVQKAGLDMDALGKEYAESGKLSDESLAKLEKAGITKAQVDAYVEGQKAVAAQVTQRLAESVGGQENLKAALEWAAGALTQPEIDAANAALQSGNEAQAKLVLTGLHSRRLAETGKDPSLAKGRASPGRGDVQGYESTAQMVKDMNSKAYKTDPAFRDQVARRIAASQF